VQVGRQCLECQHQLDQLACQVLQVLEDQVDQFPIWFQTKVWTNRHRLTLPPMMYDRISPKLGFGLKRRLGALLESFVCFFLFCSSANVRLPWHGKTWNCGSAWCCRYSRIWYRTGWWYKLGAYGFTCRLVHHQCAVQFSRNVDLDRRNDRVCYNNHLFVMQHFFQFISIKVNMSASRFNRLQFKFNHLMFDYKLWMWSYFLVLIKSFYASSVAGF